MHHSTDDRQITEQIIGAAIEVHRQLGPGLHDETYLRCLAHELALRGLQVDVDHPVHIDYKGLVLDDGAFVDLLVDSQVAVDVKTVEQILPCHTAAMQSCLRLGDIPIGLLINFQVRRLKDGGIRRVVRERQPHRKFEEAV